MKIIYFLENKKRKQESFPQNWNQSEKNCRRKSRSNFVFFSAWISFRMQCNSTHFACNVSVFWHCLARRFPLFRLTPNTQNNWKLTQIFIDGRLSTRLWTADWCRCGCCCRCYYYACNDNINNVLFASIAKTGTRAVRMHFAAIIGRWCWRTKTFSFFCTHSLFHETGWKKQLKCNFVNDRILRPIGQSRRLFRRLFIATLFLIRFGTEINCVWHT